MYLATGVLSGLANLLVVMAMLRRGLRNSFNWYVVAMAIADWLHSACLAAITQLIGAGGLPVDSGAALCKALYYAYFLCKSVSSWTVLTMSTELCISLFRPFRPPSRSRVRTGVLVTAADACALAAATSPRLVFVGPPKGSTDRDNILCSVERGRTFLYYAMFETLALTYVLPVALNLAASACSVCQLVGDRTRRGRGRRTRALLLAALASALFNAPYAAVLASTQIGLFEGSNGALFYLGLCLYYAASAWSCLGVFCNLTIFFTFNAAFRRSLVGLFLCRRQVKGA